MDYRQPNCSRISRRRARFVAGGARGVSRHTDYRRRRGDLAVDALDPAEPWPLRRRDDPRHRCQLQAGHPVLRMGRQRRCDGHLLSSLQPAAGVRKPESGPILAGAGPRHAFRRFRHPPGASDRGGASAQAVGDPRVRLYPELWLSPRCGQIRGAAAPACGRATRRGLRRGQCAAGRVAPGRGHRGAGA